MSPPPPYEAPPPTYNSTSPSAAPVNPTIPARVVPASNSAPRAQPPRAFHSPVQESPLSLNQPPTVYDPTASPMLAQPELPLRLTFSPKLGGGHGGSRAAISKKKLGFLCLFIYRYLNLMLVYCLKLLLTELALWNKELMHFLLAIYADLLQKYYIFNSNIAVTISWKHWNWRLCIANSPQFALEMLKPLNFSARPGPARNNLFYFRPVWASENILSSMFYSIIKLLTLSTNLLAEASTGFRFEGRTYSKKLLNRDFKNFIFKLAYTIYF